jgi:hypothetical protein
MTKSRERCIEFTGRGPLTMQFAGFVLFPCPPLLLRRRRKVKCRGRRRRRRERSPGSLSCALHRPRPVVFSTGRHSSKDFASKSEARTDPRSLTSSLLCHANPGFSSYGGGSGGSRKRSMPRRVLSIGAISLAGGLVLSAVNDLAIFHGCTTSASFLPFPFWLAPFKTNPLPIYSCAPTILFFLVTGGN